MAAGKGRREKEEGEKGKGEEGKGRPGRDVSQAVFLSPSSFSPFF
jgi:hypothetical protein